MSGPWLVDVAPELVPELERLLTQAGEGALAHQVAGLRLHDRCRCGDDFCAAFYTAPRQIRPGSLGIPLEVERGLLIVIVDRNEIVEIEALYRPDLRTRIHAAIP